MYFGMVNDWRLRNGARMVVVDPRLTVTASKADRWLAIRPGTDMALALALCQHILANDLEDKAFCRDWLLGFEQWREFILARGYTPEWAEPVTGIAAAEIRRLAEEIAAADGCVIFASRGVNQHSNGTQTNRALMFLAAITGNWGRRGGAYFNMSHGTPIAPNAPRGAPAEDLPSARAPQPDRLDRGDDPRQALPDQGADRLQQPARAVAGAGRGARGLLGARPAGAHRAVRERDLGLRRLRAARRDRDRERRDRARQRRPAHRLDRQDDRAAGRGEGRRLDLDRARQAPRHGRRAEGIVEGPGAYSGTRPASTTS